MCLALEYGMMPGNLHFRGKAPNPNSIGLKEGTLKVSPGSSCLTH